MKCGGTDYRKNGITRGKQRYRCVVCGYNFTNTHGHGKPPEMRLQALKLYTENVGIRSIGRLLGVNAATVVHWVRDEGKALMRQIKGSLPERVDGLGIIEIDEMWHYTQKRAQAVDMDCCISPHPANPRHRSGFSRSENAQAALGKAEAPAPICRRYRPMESLPQRHSRRIAAANQGADLHHRVRQQPGP
jgi:hypothetical protein